MALCSNCCARRNRKSATWPHFDMQGNTKRALPRRRRKRALHELWQRNYSYFLDSSFRFSRQDRQKTFRADFRAFSISSLRT